MLDRDAEERTAEPTPRRIEEARREGNVPRARGLTVAIALLGSFVALGWLGPAALARVVDLARSILSRPPPGPGRPGGDIEGLFGECGLAVAGAALPLAGAALPVLLAAAVLQGGFTFRAERLVPRTSRWSLAAGAGRLLGVRSLARALLALSRIALIAGVTAAFLDRALGRLLGAWSGEAALDPLRAGAWRTLGEDVLFLGLASGLALAALGVLEYAWERWLHVRDLRMTRAELREEVERIEGKPEWKRERRRARSRLLGWLDPAGGEGGARA
jgi:flagellar biosynthetic protein FlhB